MSIPRSIRVVLLSLTTLILLWNCQTDMLPVARDDTAATDRNVPVTIPVVTNDTASTGHIVTSTVVVIAEPGHGTAHAQADGTVLYTPVTDFVGTDSFSYVVTDTAGETSNTATVTVTVRAVNRAPVANAGPESNVMTGRPVMLDGAQSFDPDHDLLTYAWQCVAVPPTSAVTTASLMNAQTPAPRFTPDVDGTYILELTVSDGTLSSMDQVQVTAMGLPNVHPNANAGQPQTAQVGTVVRLDGTGSQDPDNGPQPLTYQWSFLAVPPESTLTATDLQEATTPRANFTPDTVGVYRVGLQVSDGRDASQTEVWITAMPPPNVAPNADAGPPMVVQLGAIVTLNGSASHDPDNGPQPLTYQWTLVFKPTPSGLTNASLQDATTATPSFTPDVAGIYVLQLEVSDGALRDVAQVRLIANVAPVAVDDTYNVDQDETLTVLAPGVLGNDTDGNNDPLTAVLGNPVSHGTLTLNTDGSFTYTPTTGFSGTDSFTYQANDGSINSNMAAVTVTVTKPKVNQAPVVNAATFSVAENSANGTAVGTVTFSDPDAGQSHTFAITAGNASGTFVLNVSTGQLTVANSAALNFETTPSFSLTVQVTDNGTPAKSGSAIITVNLTNVNEAPVTNTATFAVPENSANGTVVGTVTFTDPDAGQSHTFAITAGNTGAAFAINPGTGQLTVANSAALNIGTTPSFSLTVQVTDNGTPQLAGSAIITINLTSVNKTPVVTAATFTLAENSATGTVVGTVTFTDPDVGQSHIFTIVGGNTGGAFTVNPSTGQLTVATSAALNFETTPSFSLTVQVTDNGTPPLAGSAIITVNLTNVNEAPVVNLATFALPENGATGTVVGAVTFTDPDVAQSHTFALTGGNTSGAFALNATTGQLTVATSAALDFETTPSFSLTVQVTDNGTPPLVGSTTVTVNLTDVNEPPVAVAKNYNAQANMQIAIPAVSGLLIGATDPDDAFAALSVATVSTTNPAGGTVTLGTGGTFDFDPPPGVTGNVTFTYTVCDDGTPVLPQQCSAPAIVTFAVAGPVIWFVDDNAPSGGDGRLSHPFQTLADTAAVEDRENNNIFLFSGTYTTGLTLLTGEGLIGQGVSTASNLSFTSFDAVFGINPPVGTVARPSINGTRPTVQGTVTLAPNSEVRGFNISTSTATGLSGGTVSGVTVSEVSVTTISATAVNLNGTSGMVSLTSVSAGNTTTAPDPVNGISLTNTTGSFTVTGDGASGTGGTITNTTDNGISLINVAHASFSHMNITDSGVNGIFETSANAFVSITITNNNVVTTRPTSVNAISLNALQSSMACFNVRLNMTRAPNANGILVRALSGIKDAVSLERADSLITDTPVNVLKNNNVDLGSNIPAAIVESVVDTVNVVENNTCPAQVP
jgi:VCBS repeat-containing protein